MSNLQERLIGGQEQFPTDEEISKRAHELYLGRGAAHGRDLEDWFIAEEELRSRAAKQESTVSLSDDGSGTAEKDFANVEEGLKENQMVSVLSRSKKIAVGQQRV